MEIIFLGTRLWIPQKNIIAFHVTGYQQHSTEMRNTRDGGTACNRVLHGFIWPLEFSLLILHELI